MSKQLIQLAGVLFMLAAILVVSAQENTTSLNNATMNNITLLNNTTMNASVIEATILPTEAANETAPTQTEEIAAQNETVPAQNVTMPENITVAAEPASTAITMPVVSRPEVTQIGSPQKSPFALGGGQTAPPLIPIDGKVLSQAAYEVGLPARTIMDLSAMPFSINKM